MSQPLTTKDTRPLTKKVIGQCEHLYLDGVCLLCGDRLVEQDEHGQVTRPEVWE